MADDPRKRCAFCQQPLTWSPDRGWLALRKRAPSVCDAESSGGKHDPYDLPESLDPETVERWLSS